jgi:hypothetical protein
VPTKRSPIRSGTVTITRDGVSHHAQYTVTTGRYPVITVSSELGTKSTQVGALDAEPLARMLLSEMVPRGRAQ